MWHEQQLDGASSIESLQMQHHASGLTVFLGAELLGFRAVGFCVSQAVLAAMPSGPPELVGGKTCSTGQGETCRGEWGCEPTDCKPAGRIRGQSSRVVKGEFAGVTKSVSLQGWDLGVGPQGWEGVKAAKLG